MADYNETLERIYGSREAWERSRPERHWIKTDEGKWYSHDRDNCGDWCSAIVWEASQ